MNYLYQTRQIQVSCHVHKCSECFEKILTNCTGGMEKIWNNPTINEILKLFLSKFAPYRPFRRQAPDALRLNPLSKLVITG